MNYLDEEAIGTRFDEHGAAGQPLDLSILERDAEVLM